MDNLVQDSNSPKRIGRHDSNPHAVMNINLKYGSLIGMPRQAASPPRKYTNMMDQQNQM